MSEPLEVMVFDGWGYVPVHLERAVPLTAKTQACGDVSASTRSASSHGGSGLIALGPDAEAKVTEPASSLIA